MVRTRSILRKIQQQRLSKEEITEGSGHHDNTTSAPEGSRRNRKRVAKRARNEPDPLTGLTPSESFNFYDKSALTKWPRFCSRPFATGRSVNLDDFSSHNLFSLFDALKLSYILSISTIIYPELVRLFYCNLRKVSDNHLTSRVRGVDIDLTPSTLGEIFHVSTTGNNPLNMSFMEAMSHAGATPHSPFNTAIRRDDTIQPPFYHSNQLNERAQLIVKIIVWNLAPKTGSFNIINSVTRILLAFIWQQKNFNFAEFMIETMISQVDSIHALPYGMWLTPIFEHFSLELDDESFIPPKAPIEAEAVTYMYSDILHAPPFHDKDKCTSAGQDSVPSSSGAKTATDSIPLNRLNELENMTKELRHDLASIQETMHIQGAFLQNELANMNNKLNSLLARMPSISLARTAAPGSNLGTSSAGP